jgi:hypothetical protein
MPFSRKLKIGRFYRQQIHGDMKSCGQSPPPNQGIADTLEEAKTPLTHEEIKRAAEFD